MAPAWLLKGGESGLAQQWVASGHGECLISEWRMEVSGSLAPFSNRILLVTESCNRNVIGCPREQNRRGVALAAASSVEAWPQL